MLSSADVQALTHAFSTYYLEQPLRVEWPPQQGVNNLGLLVHTPEEVLRCKVYTHIHPLEALHYEHCLLLDLAEQGCSFALPVPRRAHDGSTLQPSTLGWLALMPNLPGTPLDPANSMHIVGFGAVLGELHHTLAGLAHIPRPGHTLFNTFFDFPPPERNPLQLQPAMIGADETSGAHDLCAWWRTVAASLADFVTKTYRQLPSQLCHNDPAPYNILVQDERVTAVLDFEFAGLAPRAFDLAMALRMTMRVWENPDPWQSARLLCSGYRRWMGLSAVECVHIPELIRLRSSMGILWALGRGAPIDPQRFLLHLTYLRTGFDWLDQYGEQLAALIAYELT